MSSPQASGSRPPKRATIVVRTIPATKRAAPSPATGKPSPRKKQRVQRAQADDTDRLYTAETIANSSGQQRYLSTRPQAPPGHVRMPASGIPPSLASIALRRLARNFRRLFADTRTGELKPEAWAGAAAIRTLPAYLAERLQPAVLEALGADPGPLDISLLELFLHSSTTAFTLPTTGLGLKVTRPLFERLRTCSNLVSLSLIGQTDLTDRFAAALLAKMPALRKLSLSGCTKVGDEAVSVLSADMREVTLSYTATGATGLARLLGKAVDLEVLKLASCNGLTDAVVSKILDQATQTAASRAALPLSKLRTLKLRGTAIGNTGIGRLLSLTPAIQHLDLSFTELTHVDLIRQALLVSPATFSLRKLILSGLLVGYGDLASLFEAFASLPVDQRRQIATIRIASMGLGRHSVVTSTGRGTPRTLQDGLDPKSFGRLTTALAALDGLRKLSLAGNPLTAPSRDESAIADFIRRVGRRCVWLDLSKAAIRRRDLEPLFPSFDPADAASDVTDLPPSETSRLETLVLDETRVGDEHCAAIASCAHLEALHLASSVVTENGLAVILSACPQLRTLDLTQCRGIALRRRRDIFAAFDEGELGGSDTELVSLQ